MDAERTVRELGIELPATPQPIGSYRPVVVAGSFAFVSGQTPAAGGQPLWSGKLGRDVSIEDGQLAARRCALQAVSALRDELGSLDRVRRIVKVTVFIASAEGFTQQPTVANGASDLLAEIFGEEGRHARAAVGVAELPLGVPVEVELIAEVKVP
jgi:enamine deaminase RidA (YjgF/YER057c/UK114 family)